MSLVKIKRNEINIINIILPYKRMTGNQLYKQYNCEYIVNLALYDMASGENIVFMESNNKQSGYLFANEGIGIKNMRDVLWTKKDIAYNSYEICGYVSGAPNLIKDYKINIEWGNKKSTQILGKHKRTSIGFNDEYLIIYCSDDNITLKTLAQRMLAYGCKYAINCDGGGSQHLQTPEGILKKSIRKNASWLVVNLKEKSDFKMYKYKNNSSKSKPVYETTECKKKIGSLDPYEECTCLYEMPSFKVVLYNITGKSIMKVGFIKED